MTIGDASLLFYVFLYQAWLDWSINYKFWHIKDLPPGAAAAMISLFGTTVLKSLLSQLATDRGLMKGFLKADISELSAIFDGQPAEKEKCMIVKTLIFKCSG